MTAGCSARDGPLKCVWIGGVCSSREQISTAQAIAHKHDLQVREVDSANEACIPTHATPDCGRFETHRVTTNARTLGNPRVLVLYVGDTGFDSPHDFTGKNADRVKCDAESDASSEARGDGDLLLADDDAGLASIVEAWPMLTVDARQAMVAFVERQVGAVVQVVDSAEPTEAA